MKSKLMAMISVVLVFVMFAGSTFAFAAPSGDVQLEQFSALQRVQAEPMSDSELSNIDGELAWVPVMAVISLAAIAYLHWKAVTKGIQSFTPAEKNLWNAIR